MIVARLIHVANILFMCAGIWKMHSKIRKLSPRGEQKCTKWYQRESKESPKITKERPKCIQKSMFERSCEQCSKKGAPVKVLPDDSGSHFPSKMCSKIDAKFYVEKVWTFMRKRSQNDAKTRSRIDDKSMKFRNLRFLIFCEVYNVKIVFSHDQGSQKSIKNQ